MPKKAKLGNTRHDKWWHLAKEQGYRSRAAFKLIQLNKKYDFLSKAKSCLDLCAAPGGWMQVAEKFMPAGSLIIGIDLLPIKPVRNCLAFQEDITSQRCRNLIKKELKAKNLSGIDVIIHDGAPNVGGNSWLKDAYGQIELVLYSLKLAVDFLRPGSFFVTKVFRSQDYNALLWVLQKFFKKIDVTKPVASRNTSAEIYVICEDFLAPKNFDPRLLDPAHLFKHIEDSTAKKEVDVLHGKNKQKRHRDGYDDDAGVVVYKERPAFEFIDADNNEALSMLGACNKFTWGKDEKSQQYRAHEATTDEVVSLCDDLKVLSRTDFAALMKWRLKVRRSLDKEKKQEKKAVDSEKPIVPVVDEDEKLTAEVEELARKKAIAEKNKKKKARELKAKERRRVALGMVTPDNLQDTPEDQGLFSLNLAKSDGDLQTLLQDNGVDSIDVGDEESGEPFVGKHGEYAEKAEELERRLQERKKEQAASKTEEEVADGEDEDIQRMRELEEAMSFMYDQYKERRNIRTKKEKARLERLGLTGEEEQDETLAAAAASKAEKKDSDDDSDDDDDDDEEEEDGLDSDADFSGAEEEDEDGVSVPAKRAKRNPLLVSLGAGARASASEKAERWFSRDLFSDVDGTAEDKSASAAAGPASRKRRVEEPAAEIDSDDDDEEVEEEEEETKGEENDDEEEDDDDDITGAKPSKKQREKDGFEEVPVDLDISDDDDAKAEIMALGQLMIRKKTRNALIDSAYNRYAFNDYGGEDVPEWFAEDEDRHSKKQLPITKEEADMYKMQLKAIDARPIKKIAEAKARKKIKTAKRWEKMKAQAQTIVDNSTLSEKDKVRQIEKLYSKKNEKKKKVERTYVVAKKGGGQSQAMAKKGATGPVKVVDPRMKKDKRALKAAEKKKGKGTKRKRK